jgi:hypothetical protein
MAAQESEPKTVITVLAQFRESRMPKLTVTPPSYRHHKPSGRAVVTLNGKDQ